MLQSFVRFCAVGSICFTIALPLAAQRPTADEARSLLQSRPDLVSQLRSKLLSSGLTPDQVRARLRAEGYPEDLLDAYLPGGMATAADSAPSSTVFDAMRALGVTDSTGTDFLQSPSAFQQEPGMGAYAGQGGSRGESGWPGASRVVCDTVFTDTRQPRNPGLASVPFDSSWIGDSVSTGDSARPVTRGSLNAATGKGQPQLICRPVDRLAVQNPDSGFAIFGQDMFAQRTTQFAPNLAGPVDDSYKLGPGDELVLILTGDVEAAHTLDVTREGFVVIPQVGQLHVANLTLGQLRDLLYTRLGRVYSGIRRGSGATTKFSVSVARLRTNQVFVVGDVARPGSYRVSSAGTALTALYAAGGPTENGSLRRIEIRRGGAVVDTLDVYDYLLQGDASHDARLESGDVVFVPVHGSRVRVVGEVVRPATYELEEGETLVDLIHAAGGYTPGASRERVQIERILPPGEREAGGRDRVVMDIVAQRTPGVGEGGEGDEQRVRWREHHGCRRKRRSWKRHCGPRGDGRSDGRGRRRARLPRGEPGSQSHHGAWRRMDAGAAGLHARNAPLRRDRALGRNQARCLPWPDPRHTAPPRFHAHPAPFELPGQCRCGGKRHRAQ